MHAEVNKAVNILEAKSVSSIMAARSDAVALTASVLAAKTRLLLVS